MKPPVFHKDDIAPIAAFYQWWVAGAAMAGRAKWVAAVSCGLALWLYFLCHLLPLVFPSLRPAADGSFSDPDVDLAFTIASLAMLFFGALALVTYIYHFIFPRRWRHLFEVIYLSVEDKMDEATYWTLLRHWDALRAKVFANVSEVFLRDSYEKAVKEVKQLTHEL